MFPFFDAIFHTTSPGDASPPPCTPRQLFSLCFVIRWFYALFTHSVFTYAIFRLVFSFFSERVCSGFSCPFVLFMMIHFIAHFLWIFVCVGCDANKARIFVVFGRDISTKLSPCTCESQFMMIQNRFQPLSDGICSALGILHTYMKINPNWIICHLRLFGNFLLHKIFYFCASIIDVFLVVIVVVSTGAVVVLLYLKQLLRIANNFDYYLRNIIN